MKSFLVGKQIQSGKQCAQSKNSKALTLQAEKTPRRGKGYLKLPALMNVYCNYKDDFLASSFNRHEATE